MYYAGIVTTILALTPTLSLGTPILAARQISAFNIGIAQLIWAGDTSRVSQFLSMAPSLSGQDLVNAAASALAAEGDELNQKGALDAAFLDVDNLDPNVVAANTTLVNDGTLQFVVDGLRGLVANGASFTPDQVNMTVTLINGVRCGTVLPAIDAYLQAAAELSGKPLPNAAVRPNNCP
ncbi:hypothetical protein Z517_06466 [Fonsecaea pedrosoi CBS 271.37]|uniref:Uncharacterized protein n=1 Tax=Fonsecaea pedrosoi CBS 271.37 TaxID=1442368 RepID=A0A0D2DQ02_9EURO|nr:uncharacterized protein Z517_06466 [Fonsecaea pedrosoi CBS 271.37]KIW79851.1 hypothetical protein Z517_06466 [Fonsecaea pedrosoi CBS 271.37]